MPPHSDFSITSRIESLNQRGGRMLSIIDLVLRDTINTDMAAYLLERANAGVSFLCCAGPGGAGKTALMGALLSLLPWQETFVTVSSPDLLPGLERDAHVLGAGDTRCLVVHEIGRGRWYGYLWGPPVLHYFSLKDDRTRLSATIHADTLHEIHEQLVSFGGEPRELLVFDVVLFITKERGGRHVVTSILEARNGTHVPVFTAAGRGWKGNDTGGEVEKARRKYCKQRVRAWIDSGLLTLEDLARPVQECHRSIPPLE